MNTCVMALGTFDGVHLGHAALIGAAAQRAKQLNISTAVFTFGDHPLEKLTGRKVGLLVPLKERIKLLRQAGADVVAVENFEDVCNFSPEEFVDFLVSKYRVRGLVCGTDFRFGKGGIGDAQMLKTLGARRNLSVLVVSFVLDGAGKKISSGNIRKMISKGDMRSAAASLGRPYYIEDDVRHGKGLAHQWGTPTINLPLPAELVYPKFGVYQTQVTVSGKTYDGITNVGCRPTFDDGKTPNVETYILDGSFESIAAARVEFVRFIREEIKFENEAALQAQIAKDIEKIRKG
ncbi:MAG: bifunctional riboflavin kinase/FAD synthetase [Clostridia bacterium]|nr:bifunctional riboflavin kinase/FAD synthetase [Clostridia bacterium]